MFRQFISFPILTESTSVRHTLTTAEGKKNDTEPSWQLLLQIHQITN